MDIPEATLAAASWRTSTYSGAQGDCIEVADGVPGAVPVRDSKDAAGPVLAFTLDAWRAFVMGVQAGEFPLRG